MTRAVGEIHSLHLDPFRHTACPPDGQRSPASRAELPDTELEDVGGSSGAVVRRPARMVQYPVVFSIEIEREKDGRWLAEVPALAGVMCYGADRDEAVARVQALALRVIADRLEHREAPAEFLNVQFQAA